MAPASADPEPALRGLEVSADIGLDGVLPVTSVWRGTRRTVELAFGAIRDPVTWGMPCSGPRMAAGGRLRLPDRRAGPPRPEDLDRRRGLRQRQPARTVCWVPRRLPRQTVSTSARYVRLRYALGPSFDQLAGHLSDNDRAIARQQMTALAEQLSSTLSNACCRPMASSPGRRGRRHRSRRRRYVRQPGAGPVAPGTRRSRAAPGIGRSAGSVLSWEFPGHPPFPAEVRRPDLQKVHAQVRGPSTSPSTGSWSSPASGRS